MAKKELKLHAVVSPTETVIVSAYLGIGETIGEAFQPGKDLKKVFDNSNS